jgi:hypothetical protein
MRRIRRIVFASLASAAPLLAQPATAAPRASAAKPPVHRSPPVSAEHRKALAELYNRFKFGMTKDEVVAVFAKQLDERYDDKIKATTDITEQDRLRRDKKAEISRLKASYVSFDSTKPSSWDVSVIEDEFARNTGEAMLERWENQAGQNQRRFFFFHGDKLWKMFVLLDVSSLSDDNKNFAAFRSRMEGQYGPGEVEPGRITWRTPEFDVRAVDKLKTYDALALVIEDPKARAQIDTVRAAKAQPKKTGNPVINAVIDPDHKDHPDVRANSNAVDTVIRAQGGTPPGSKP